MFAKTTITSLEFAVDKLTGPGLVPVAQGLDWLALARQQVAEPLSASLRFPTTLLMSVRGKDAVCMAPSLEPKAPMSRSSAFEVEMVSLPAVVVPLADAGTTAFGSKGEAVSRLKLQM